MARTFNDIEQSIITETGNHPEIAEINTPSSTGVLSEWRKIVAFAIWFLETLWDKFRSSLEVTIAAAPTMTNAWVQNKVLQFQYDATTPQIIQLNNYVPGYAVVDLSKRIITRCSTKTLPSKIVAVKVAKSEPPEPLTLSELNSLQGMLNDISPAGVQYSCTSLAPDYLYLNADIYYNGQYAAVISANVIAAIQTYLANIPFDGNVRLQSIVDSIQAVPGVTDVVLKDVALRANSVDFASTTYLLQGSSTIYHKYPLVSGYVIPEVGPNDFSTSLNFITE